MAPSLRTYVVFISHAWRYHDDYTRIVDLLDNASLFQWRNASVPKTDAFDKSLSNKQLREALDEQVRISNVVVILAGMYAAHSEWIEEEIALAARYSKPIIGVVPWGAQRTPAIVETAAREMVRWNTDKIVSAIRRALD